MSPPLFFSLENIFALQRRVCICQGLLLARNPFQSTQPRVVCPWNEVLHPIRSSSPYPSAQPPIKLLTSHRHLQSIERILHNVVRVEFVHLSHNGIAIRLMRFREEQELHPRRCLKAR